MNSPYVRNLALLVLGVAVGGLFSVASSMSFQDEVEDQAHYCSMVESGAWPDYRENYYDVCL